MLVPSYAASDNAIEVKSALNDVTNDPITPITVNQKAQRALLLLNKLLPQLSGNISSKHASAIIPEIPHKNKASSVFPNPARFPFPPKPSILANKAPHAAKGSIAAENTALVVPAEETTESHFPFMVAIMLKDAAIKGNRAKVLAAATNDFVPKVDDSILVAATNGVTVMNTKNIVAFDIELLHKGFPLTLGIK